MKWLLIFLASLMTSMLFGQTRVEIIKEYDEQGNLTRIDSVVTEKHSTHDDTSMNFDELIKEFDMDSLFSSKQFEDIKMDLSGLDEQFKSLFDNDELKDMMQDLMKESEEMIDQMMKSIDGMELDKLLEEESEIIEENSNKKTKSDKKKKKEEVEILLISN